MDFATLKTYTQWGITIDISSIVQHDAPPLREQLRKSDEVDWQRSIGRRRACKTSGRKQYIDGSSSLNTNTSISSPIIIFSSCSSSSSSSISRSNY